jgi:hypothetical protein
MQRNAEGRGGTNVLAGFAGAEGVDPLYDLDALVISVIPGPGFGHGSEGLIRQGQEQEQEQCKILWVLVRKGRL